MGAREGGLLKRIPASLEYLFVETAPDAGLVHIIESAEKFKADKILVS